MNAQWTRTMSCISSAIVIGLLWAGCTPAYWGQPPTAELNRRRAGYRVWYDGQRWHVWATVGRRRAHRFHGFIAVVRPQDERPFAVRGAVDLRTTGRLWRQNVHLLDRGISFDVTTNRSGGFSWLGSYAGFELAIDGFYRPERVFLGVGTTHPTSVPWVIDAR